MSSLESMLKNNGKKQMYHLESMPRKDKFMSAVARPTVLRNTQKRTRRIQKHTSVDAKKSKEYEVILEKLRKAEAKKEKIEREIEAKIAPLRKKLGIDVLEEKIIDIEDDIDELLGDKERFEALVIQLINDGVDVKQFLLQIVSKRFAVSYKAICEAVFDGRPHEFAQAKERYGSRKEQYLLRFKGEEVSRRQVTQVVPQTPHEKA